MLIGRWRSVVPRAEPGFGGRPEAGSAAGRSLPDEHDRIQVGNLFALILRLLTEIRDQRVLELNLLRFRQGADDLFRGKPWGMRLNSIPPARIELRWSPDADLWQNLTHTLAARLPAERQTLHRQDSWRERNSLNHSSVRLIQAHCHAGVPLTGFVEPRQQKLFKTMQFVRRRWSQKRQPDPGVFLTLPPLGVPNIPAGFI